MIDLVANMRAPLLPFTSWVTCISLVRSLLVSLFHRVSHRAYDEPQTRPPDPALPRLVKAGKF